MLMRFLLDIVYLIGGILAAPFVAFKAATSERWRVGWKERLGGVPGRQGAKTCVWIHAASVGEVNAIRELVALIDKGHSNWDVRISTMTNTGQDVARKQFGAGRCFYFPLDLSFLVGRVFRRIRPDVVLLVELELWPNFLSVARRRRVPVMVVNGRMREERVLAYRIGRVLFRAAFDSRTGNRFCVQNAVYRDRFLRIGVPEGMIETTGNIKYDSLRTNPDVEKARELQMALGLKPEDRYWVAACTWPGEEAICLRVHERLREYAPDLRLVIAPRHIERADEVAQLVVAAGMTIRRRSAREGPDGPSTVGLLDTVGELGYLYASAQVAFVGKSLTAQGGHNMLEPAALGAPPVFGPHADNFEAEARLLLEAGAAEQVADEAELADALHRLLEDPDLRRRRSERGREAVVNARGASRRTLDILRALVSGRDSHRKG